MKNTDIKRKDFLPQTSDSAPSNGAERKDNKPWKRGGEDKERKRKRERKREQERRRKRKKIRRRGRGRERGSRRGGERGRR